MKLRVAIFTLACLLASTTISFAFSFSDLGKIVDTVSGAIGSSDVQNAQQSAKEVQGQIERFQGQPKAVTKTATPATKRNKRPAVATNQPFSTGQVWAGAYYDTYAKSPIKAKLKIIKIDRINIGDKLHTNITAIMDHEIIHGPYGGNTWAYEIYGSYDNQKGTIALNTFTKWLKQYKWRVRNYNGKVASDGRSINGKTNYTIEFKLAASGTELAFERELKAQEAAAAAAKVVAKEKQQQQVTRQNQQEKKRQQQLVIQKQNEEKTRVEVAEKRQQQLAIEQQQKEKAATAKAKAEKKRQQQLAVAKKKEEAKQQQKIASIKKREREKLVLFNTIAMANSSIAPEKFRRAIEKVGGTFMMREPEQASETETQFTEIYDTSAIGLGAAMGVAQYVVQKDMFRRPKAKLVAFSYMLDDLKAFKAIAPKLIQKYGDPAEDEKHTTKEGVQIFNKAWQRDSGQSLLLVSAEFSSNRIMAMLDLENQFILMYGNTKNAKIIDSRDQAATKTKQANTNSAF